MRVSKRCSSLIASALAFLLMLPAPSFALESWERIYGQNAYDTMQKIVRSDGVFTAESVDTVIVATGEGYWDALAASGLAGRVGGPVLITPTKSLAPQTREEIVRLKPERVLVMGGPLAIDEGVVNELKKLAPSVERIYGDGASDTAIKICAAGEGWSDTAIVATSDGYWDALSIAPYAYAKATPIFLTTSDKTLSSAAVDAIRGSFDNVVIVGGPLAVSSAVEGQLKGLNIERLQGQDALETSALIASWGLQRGLSAENLCVATTEGYYDALTGASLAGAEDAALVLMNPKGGAKAIEKLRSQGVEVANGRVFGGPLAISEENVKYLEDPDYVPSWMPRDYVLNTNSMKFHYPDCPSVDRMAYYNREDVYASRDEIIARGYDSCGRCNP